MTKNFETLIKEFKIQDTTSLYRKALEIQLKLTASDILDFLDDTECWWKAENILDIGCGPGDLTTLLSQKFPDKNYTGIDLSEDFINIAKKNSTSKNIEFLQQDIYNYSPQITYDFIHARAVLQHLPSIPKFLEKLDDLTHSGSSVLFFDAGDADNVQTQFSPDIPSYNDFMKKITLAQKEGGGNRDCLRELEELIPSSSFKTVKSQDILTSIRTNLTKVEATSYIYLVIEVLDRIYKTDFNKEILINELRNWYKDSNANGEFHGKWLLVSKR